MNAAELRRAAETLPLTQESLLALVCATESFAAALVHSGLVIGADKVHDLCLDAFQACEEVEAITHEMRSEWALSDMLNRREVA